MHAIYLRKRGTVRMNVFKKNKFAEVGGPLTVCRQTERETEGPVLHQAGPNES